MRYICAIIPARYHSSRLPGKPLLKISGKTIIRRTYEQTRKSRYIDKVYVATDDDRIVDEVNGFSCNSVIKTDKDCLNGTERICYVLDQIDPKYDIIVNVQGDEPYIDPAHIDFSIEKYLENEDDTMMVCTTIHCKITDSNDLSNRTCGKMVMDCTNNVMYCSRVMIPHTKSGHPAYCSYYRHIGIFVFRRSYLPQYLKDENTPAQLAEDIEWLKIIEMGYKIKSFEVPSDCEVGVNTVDDYNHLLNKYDCTPE